MEIVATLNGLLIHQHSFTIVQRCTDGGDSRFEIGQHLQYRLTVKSCHCLAYQFALAHEQRIVVDQIRKRRRLEAVALRHAVVLGRGQLMQELLKPGERAMQPLKLLR